MELHQINKLVKTLNSQVESGTLKDKLHLIELSVLDSKSFFGDSLKTMKKIHQINQERIKANNKTKRTLTKHNYKKSRAVVDKISTEIYRFISTIAIDHKNLTNYLNLLIEFGDSNNYKKDLSLYESSNHLCEIGLITEYDKSIILYFNSFRNIAVHTNITDILTEKPKLVEEMLKMTEILSQVIIDLLDDNRTLLKSAISVYSDRNPNYGRIDLDKFLR